MTKGDHISMAKNRHSNSIINNLPSCAFNLLVKFSAALLIDPCVKLPQVSSSACLSSEMDFYFGEAELAVSLQP